MWGGSGSNTLIGGAGSDVLVNADGGATTMIGGTGNSLFVEAGGTALVYGGSGNDTFLAYGNSTMTVVEGNGNNEAMFGSGAMTVYGGTGTDLYDFVLGNGGGTDVINGFKSGTDQLRLYGYDTSAVNQTTAGGNTTLMLSDGTTIILAGITNLSASSII
jgi:Ca2+-binding RTX toxin-like protein